MIVPFPRTRIATAVGGLVIMLGASQGFGGQSLERRVRHRAGNGVRTYPIPILDPVRRGVPQKSKKAER